MLTRIRSSQLALPVRPFRLIRTFLGAAALRVPLSALMGMGALLLGASVLGGALGDGVLATIGAWSATGVLGTAGLIGGGLVGLVAAAERTLSMAESDLRTWFERLPREEGERLFPSTDLERLRGGYDAIVDTMFDQTLGRLPMPRFARRTVKSRFRQAIIGDFLEHCERTGTPTVGFTEVAEYLVGKGVAVATAPAHAQLQLWNILLLGVVGALLAIPLLIGALAGSVTPVHVILGTFAGLAALLLFWKLPHASRYRNPGRFRLGILTIALGLVGWPLIYVRLWPHDLGLAWIVVLGFTAWTFNVAIRQAVWEADR